MIKGYLKYFVMKYLSEKEMSGYGLMNKLEEASGKRPSSGSIYPLLKDMEESGLVKSKEKGRKKAYSLTLKGKKTYKEFATEKEILIKHMKRGMRAISALSGKTEQEMINQMSAHVGVGEKILRVTSPEMLELKSLLFSIVNSQDYEKKEEKVRKILKETNQKLKKLNKLK